MSTLNEVNENNTNPSESAITPSGTKTIIALGVATIISFLGTMMTDFALGQWVFIETGSATKYGLIGFAALVPKFIFAPLIGALLDRYSRGVLMIIGHAGAGICTLILLYLYSSNLLDIGWIVLLVGISSFFNGIVTQSFTVLVPVIVKKEHLTRVQGVVGGGFGIIEILVPAMAAASIVFLGMSSIFIFDILTFMTAICLVLVVMNRLASTDGRSASVEKESLKHQMSFGFKYLAKNKALLNYLMFMTTIYFCGGMIFVLYAPLILSISDVAGLGIVSTVVGIGSFLGSAFLAMWKGSSSKLYLIYCGLFMMAVLMISTSGVFLVAETTLILLAIIFMCHAAAFVVVRGCDVVIWQTAVPKSIQGRVLGVQSAILYAATPVAFLVAGPLADFVFEPLMSVDGALANSVGRIIGVGQGRGIVLMYVISGMLILLSLFAFAKKCRGWQLSSTIT